MTIHLRTLGHIHLRDDAGVELRSLLTQPKRLALLVYLASNGADGRMCRRDSLLAMFWPESDAERARNSLRQAVHFIKQAAGSDVVVTRGADELSLSPGAVSMDAAMLDELADADRHEEVVAMHTGDFLNGFFVRGAPEFEQWVGGERSRLRTRAADSAWLATEQCLAKGDAHGARTLGARALALSSNNETAVRRFITLLAESGDRAAALAVYQDFAGQMAKEYGVAPSPETRALVDRLEVADSAPHAEPLTVVAPVAVAAASPASPVRPWRRATLIAAAAALIIAAFVSILRPVFGNPDSGSDPNRMLVLPFVVRGAPSLRYLEDGLPILLGTRLDGAGSLRTVDARALIVHLGDDRGSEMLAPEKARTVASQFGAQLYVLGSIVGTSDKLRFSASLYDRSHGSDPIAHTEVEGAEAELVHVVDKLAGELLAARFREAGGAIAETAARTTSSLPALKAWLAGETAITAGRYGPAMAALREAIAADSNFAMAHFRLAVAANWSGLQRIADDEMQRAMALSGRTSPSTRLVMQAFVDQRRGNYVRAEQALRTVLAEQPSNAEAWYELGDVLFHGNPSQGRPVVAAREAFANALRLNPHNSPAAIHLSRIAAAQGDAVGLDRLSRVALDSNPDAAQRGELILLRALSLRDETARTAFLALPLTLDRSDALWRASEYTGNLAMATAIADSLVRIAPAGEARASWHLLLAHLAMGRERFGDAERHLDSVSVHAPRSAAATRLLLATHPALPAALRDAFVRRALADASPLPRASLSRLVYLASSYGDTVDIPARYATAIARAMQGDSSSIHQLAATEESILLNRLIGARLRLALATDARTRAAALHEVAALDSLCSAQYTSQTAFAPRVLYHLGVARALEADGRLADAEQRLHAVPEDFGFNVAYLAEVQRRRAGLLDRLKRPGEAEAARRAMRAILQ